MSKRFGFMTAIAIASVAVLSFSLTAEPPTPKPIKVLQLPDDAELPIKVVDPDPETVQKIRQALHTGDADKTGNPGLDDVLRGQRSILKGSVLEESPDAPPNQTESQQARVAEQLLKAARLLENVKPIDKTRRELVNQLRRESIRLLSP